MLRLGVKPLLRLGVMEGSKAECFGWGLPFFPHERSKSASLNRV